MSVICYEDDRFYRLASTLKYLHAQDIAHLWRYPDEWQNEGMFEPIEKFVQMLRSANINASNVRYKEDAEYYKLDMRRNGEWYDTIYELVKALQGVNYNTDEAMGFDDTKDKLKNLIFFFMNQIVSRLPEYERAKTW